MISSAKNQNFQKIIISKTFFFSHAFPLSFLGVNQRSKFRSTSKYNFHPKIGRESSFFADRFSIAKKMLITGRRRIGEPNGLINEGATRCGARETGRGPGGAALGQRSRLIES